MDDHIVALVVARPGRLRDGWRALLLATGQIESVSMADDTSMAIRAARALNPDLALVDVEALGSESWALLTQIKAQQPGCRCIALAGDMRQLEEAQFAGVDASLVKGFPAAGLFETVRRLLAEGGPETDRDGHEGG